MKIAVCVKYVPVVSRIKFDYEKKTIIREGVPSEVNAFDALGLVRAVQMKHGPGDEVLAITMGPSQAKEGLVYCLALGADRAIHLTDRALAGSDTLATARALSLALAREQPDLVICGRNSSDAETGQVGPELAELLGIPHISQVRKLEYQAGTHRIVTERVTDEGYQVIESPLPALVCVTEGIASETFPNRQQMAEAQGRQESSIEQVSCAQLSSDLSVFGAAGSPTWVADIQLVEPNRLGVVISEAEPEAAALKVALLLRERLASLDEGVPRQIGAAPTAIARYPNRKDQSIWVVAETIQRELRRVTLELLGKARELSATTQSEVATVLIGPLQDGLIPELAAYGADRVLILDETDLGAVSSRGVAEALATAVLTAQPYAVLFPSTPDGRDLASRVSARLGLGLTGDAIDLKINDQGQLVQLKPALGGNVVAPILSKTLPNMVTLRPGLLTPIVPDRTAKASVERIDAPTFRGSDIKVVKSHFQEDLGANELMSARVVLGVGMGIGGPENLPEIRALAQSIGATLAATRDVVHAGWLPHQIQVGISGRTIAPRVYLAVGIRGAFNHTVGIQKAGTILAMNNNPNPRRSPIFQAADFSIVGDWKTYLPPLIEALRPILLETESPEKA